MGYHGKPSKGCGMCRQRKIRCDEARPACAQCIRTNRQCPGYRDQLELIFRDVTAHVARKAITSSSASSSSASAASAPDPHKRQAPPHSSRYFKHGRNMAPSISSSGTSFADSIVDFNSDPNDRVPMYQFRPSPVIMSPSRGLSKQEAICFFLQSHAIPGSHLMADNLTKFLMEPGGSLGQQAIQSSVVAVASAMLSRVRKEPSLRQTARLEYGNSLRLINGALADPVESKTNQALGAVILMALYEVVVSRAPQGIEGWTNHISGAAALLEHRGFTQMTSEVGVRLFLHLRYQIINSCLQRDVRVPTNLLESSKLDLFPQLKEILGNKLILIIGHLSNLRADIHAKVYKDPQQVLSAAYTIEADLIAWLAALPPDFTYSNHTLMPMDRTFARRCRGIRPYNNVYHGYPDIWAPSCWNHYRVARILVSEIILSHVHKLSESSPMASLSEDFRSYCNTLRSSITRLGLDICRSVPFHFGACNSEMVTEIPMLPSDSYLGGLMLLWPLFIAGMVQGPKHPQRLWVRECLDVIGHTMGIDQALAIKDLLAVDPGMFHSVEKYGEAADPSTGSPDVLSISIFHVPYYELPGIKEYREIRASSA
ncbi:hypothetical protein N7532_010016 [Penicillium argentinense]|uniref:Zn(2)-C6 fungal-type domain-containing protein n=1 Tax=Penicillium argentinense TaxID=1131581 RepID=A0A9W9JXM2_9EURO|nr:uncharacterized protein N7532_010016 [Penicillium argentinense]KAJ5085245.1 hypothetical protein N7532_010016 [Penicillium argentinense]